jgi:hypothetical protein
VELEIKFKGEWHENTESYNTERVCPGRVKLRREHWKIQI